MVDWYDHHAYAFLEGTQELTNTEVGIYKRLLDHQFCRGGFLPRDLDRVAKLVGITLGGRHPEEEAFNTVMELKFEHGSEGWFNQRMLETCRRVQQLTRGRAKAGRKGGKARAANLAAEAKEKRRNTPPAGPPLPEELDTPEFKRAWDEWLVWRRKHRWSVRESWQLRQLNMLARYGAEVAKAALEQSMDQGWQGVFPEKARAGAASRRASPDGLEGGSDYSEVF